MERIAEIREKVTPFVVLEKPTFTILTAKGPKPVVVPISAVRGIRKSTKYKYNKMLKTFSLLVQITMHPSDASHSSCKQQNSDLEMMEGTNFK